MTKMCIPDKLLTKTQRENKKLPKMAIKDPEGLIEVFKSYQEIGPGSNSRPSIQNRIAMNSANIKK
jgi:hypothetical protein